MTVMLCQMNTVPFLRAISCFPTKQTPLWPPSGPIASWDIDSLPCPAPSVPLYHGIGSPGPMTLWDRGPAPSHPLAPLVKLHHGVNWHAGAWFSAWRLSCNLFVMSSQGQNLCKLTHFNRKRNTYLSSLVLWQLSCHKWFQWSKSKQVIMVFCPECQL